nr:MAG TPA: hypothetical protein [Crassvirales sp.]
MVKDDNSSLVIAFSLLLFWYLTIGVIYTSSFLNVTL